MISRISRFMTTIVGKYMRATGFSSAIEYHHLLLGTLGHRTQYRCIG